VSDIDVDPDDDDLPPTPIVRPNVYGTDQAHELAIVAVQPTEPMPEALGSPISAGRAVRSSKKYVVERKSKWIDRKKWF
jgi:hypothetical protein